MIVCIKETILSIYFWDTLNSKLNFELSHENSEKETFESLFLFKHWSPGKTHHFTLTTAPRNLFSLRGERGEWGECVKNMAHPEVVFILFDNLKVTR